MGACYLLEFPNGKFYVGITTKPVAKRFKTHCRAAKQEQWAHLPVYRAMRKYGPESVTIHTLAESEDWSTLCRYERMFIAFYGSNQNVYGYNRTSGGGVCPDLSEESRARMSAATRERSRSMWQDPAYRAMKTANSRSTALSQWTKPSHREMMRGVQRNKKRRAMEAVAASIDDYGAHSGQGIAPPVDFEDRVRAAVYASPLGAAQLANLAGLSHASIYDFATRRRQRGLRPVALRKLAIALGVEECEVASLDDYGPHAGAGIAPPVDFEDRVRAAVQASPLGYKQLAVRTRVDIGCISAFATRTHQRGLRPASLRRLAVALGVEECEATQRLTSPA